VNEMVEQEREHRLGLWRELQSYDSASAVPISLLHERRVYQGGSGIWYDASRTKAVSESGVAVSVLHTGRCLAKRCRRSGFLVRA
jgi:hypothetical protein